MNIIIDKKTAKQAVLDKHKVDPNLGEESTEAHHLQLQLLKESNRHKEAMGCLGFSGRMLGKDVDAATFIACIVILFCMVAFFISFISPICLDNPSAEFIKMMQSISDKSLGLGSAALAYVFGKSTK